MAADILSREQRLRKQAELQTLYTNLASLRDREGSYIEAAAPVPDLFLKQISELRHQIVNTENELAKLDSQNTAQPGQEAYHQGFEAELNQNYPEAVKLYRKAARYSYPDASAAVRSTRYLSKRAGIKPDSGQMWMPSTTGSSRKSTFIGAGVVLILVLVIIFTLFGRVPVQPQEAIAVESTATSTPTPTNLPAPIVTPTNTATGTPLPTNTPVPVAPAQTLPTDTPTPEPTLTSEPELLPTLGPPPKVIGPKNGLVWGDGAIVFEFEDFKLADDELYCLNVLRGYDRNNAENWSFEPVGEQRPRIAIDANAFHVAKAQDIQCIVWSAYIAKDTCENVISESSEERTIGLPRPCDFGNK